MIRMVEAHDRLQRAAAEMNTLRFRTINSNVDGLSQGLSQIPGGDGDESPIGNRRKRSRGGETPVTMRSSLSVDMTPVEVRSALKVRSIGKERGAVKMNDGRDTMAQVDSAAAQASPKRRTRFDNLVTPLRETPLRLRSSKSVETPVVKDTPRIPLTILKNRLNVPTPSGSVTQDEEGEYVPLKKAVTHGTQFTDLIVDEDGFSQFDI